MNIFDLLTQPESRRIEFKEKLPQMSDICKTVVAFVANFEQISEAENE